MKTYLKWTLSIVISCFYYLESNAQISQSTDSLTVDSIANQKVDTIKLTIKQDTFNAKVKKEPVVVTKYLVLRSKDIYRKNRFFEEHQRFVVRTYDKKKMRGRLLIYNDSTIGLYNSMSGKVDTFLLSNVRVMNRVSLFSNLMGVTYFIASPIYIIIGYDMLLYGGFFGELLGSWMIFQGIGSGLGGGLWLVGIPLPRTAFDYHIYNAKGFKLKKSMIKYLYP